MTTLLIAIFLIGWTAAALIGTQAYFRGEQTKPIHERNLKSEFFELLAKSFTGTTATQNVFPLLLSTPTLTTIFLEAKF